MLRSRGWLWLCLALALPAPGRTDVLPVPVRTFQLANGLTVLMAPDSQATTVDVAVWYPAGTRYERAGMVGITHLFDGLMFGGSRHYPPGEHRRLLQGEGATINTFTTPDFSCFYQNLPAPALETALRLEADRMGYLTLTQRTLEAGRAGVREERRASAERTPLGRGLQKLFATAFAGHPYRWPVSGLEADLSRITLQDCLGYYREHYTPNGALLTLVGRMEPAAAEAAVRRIFGALPRRGAGARPSPLAAQGAERRGGGAVDLQVPLLFAGWRTPPDGDPDAPALGLLSRLLARGTTSRLTKALTGEGGIALLARGGYDSRREGGLIYALIAVRPDADSAKVEQRLVGEVEKLGEELVTATELDQARRQAMVGQLGDWQTTRGLAQSLGGAQLLDGDWRAAERRLERLRELTPEDLRKAAARSLVAACRTLVWMRPSAVSAPEGGTAPPSRSPLPRRGAPAKKGGR